MIDGNVEKPPRMSQLEVSKTPQTIPPPTQPESTGHSRYVNTKFHARGGMGEVWICQDSHLGREVAVKRLCSDGQLARRRFLAEAHVTGQLEHPGIVPIHDVGEDETGRPYYVMKFVRGRSLKQAIEDYYAKTPDKQMPKPLQWRRLLEVFVDLCHAVAYAHSRGVLHRDLKPDNVMLGTYGETLLLDWGLAKVHGETAPLAGVSSILSAAAANNTAAGSVIGSPLYMPPEMAEGRIADTDERTDIYLLGATLFEILTGRTPREGKSFDELLSMARTAAVVPPSKLRAVPKALNAICIKAMSKKPEDRYVSAMEVAEDMERYLADEPVSAYRESLVIRVWRWAKRHQVALKRIAATVMVVTACLVTFATTRQLSQLRGREAARAQIQTFEKLTDEARFFAASSDPSAEHAPYFDAAKGRIASQQALLAAAGWGPTLEGLPFPDQRPGLREQMYELILLVVQDACRSPQNLASADVPRLLERARQLMPAPSRGYYALEAEYARLTNDAERAADQQHLVDDPATPSIAFDSFLRGEEFRTHSAAPVLSPAASDAVSPQRADDLSQAIHFYRDAIRQDPRHFWAHFQLGRCYMSLGELPQAVEALGACIALRPDAPWGYSARGMALGLLGRFDEAHSDLERAIQLDADFRPAWLNRGVVDWLQHDDKDALASFDQALRPPEDRRLIEGAYYRAQIYLEQNDVDRALGDLNSSIAERPDFYPAYLLRARARLLQGAQAPGLEDLDALLKYDIGPSFDAQSPQGLGKRGRMLRLIAAEMPIGAAVPTLRLATQDLETAIRLGGPSAQVDADLGAVLDLQGVTAGAVAAYSDALKLDPRNVQTLIDRGWAFQKLGRNDDARADFTAAVDADPINAEAHVGLGYIAACQGSYPQAQAEAAKALLFGPDDYLILHNVAFIYAEMSRTDLPHQVDEQTVTVATLAKAISLWRARGTGPDELRLIKQEPSYAFLLRDVPQFQKLIRDAERANTPSPAH